MKSHHWITLAVVIVILYHYRTQLLALWRGSVAPALASVLPPSMASVLPSSTHPLDIPKGALNDSTVDESGGVKGGLSLFQGPLARNFFGVPDSAGYQSTPGGLGGGAIEQGNNGGTNNIPNAFGNCSTNPYDGKLLCP